MAINDDVPRTGSELEDEGIPDIDEPPPNLRETGDTGEGLVPPRDYPVAADDWGTTLAEERMGESLEARMLREEPDFGQGDAEQGAVGRLVEPESAVDEADLTKESVAFDVGVDGGGMSAEEAAMHITDEP